MDIKLVEHHPPGVGPLSPSTHTIVTQHAITRDVHEHPLKTQDDASSSLETGIIIAIAIATVGGICCMGVILLQVRTFVISPW